MHQETGVAGRGPKRAHMETAADTEYCKENQIWRLRRSVKDPKRSY